jgi:hypothetical protein
MSAAAALWPVLTYADWRDTALTLQLWIQIVGKIRLGLTPWLNHSWQVPLYVSSRGLGTSPIPTGTEIFEIEFDFIEHRLRIRTSLGTERLVVLAAQPVSEFYSQLMSSLHELGINVSVNEMPNEVAAPIAFSKDKIHRSYDPAAVHAFWRVLIQADRIFRHFRTGFLGKASPVHLFWGALDLAVTRFSGRKAPLHPGGIAGLPDAVTREAYSHEVSSAGFWPGNDAFPIAAFYSYAYPQPPGFRDRAVSTGAYFEEKLGEFILPYDTVRKAPDPEALILDFLSSTYEAAADNAHWDRAQLECPLGVAGRVRPLQRAGHITD